MRASMNNNQYGFSKNSTSQVQNHKKMMNGNIEIGFKGNGRTLA